MNDSDYMRMALSLAEKGAGYVSPNPLVGAVVVKNGSIVGKGFHQSVGGPHAEVHAIAEAGDAARGATLYVTLEPCNHLGRTPPCTRKILDAGIHRVVVAMADPNPHVAGGGNAFLMSRGLEVSCGTLESDARKLNEVFLNYTRTGRPFVVLKLAATLDGRIATHTGDARWVTGPAARGRVHQLRHAVDAIMVGVGTVIADDPSLTTRLDGAAGVDPTRIVVDSRLRMPQTSQLLRQSSPADTWVFCGPDADAAKRKRLRSSGAHVFEMPTKAGRVDLDAMVERLGARGIASVLIEGGAQLAASAMRADIVDKVLFFYAPKLLAGDGVPMFSGQGPDLMADCVPLHDIEVSRVGEDILVTGYRHSQADHPPDGAGRLSTDT